MWSPDGSAVHYLRGGEVWRAELVGDRVGQRRMLFEGSWATRFGGRYPFSQRHGISGDLPIALVQEGQHIAGAASLGIRHAEGVVPALDHVVHEPVLVGHEW